MSDDDGGSRHGPATQWPPLNQKSIPRPRAEGVGYIESRLFFAPNTPFLSSLSQCHSSRFPLVLFSRAISGRRRAGNNNNNKNNRKGGENKSGVRHEHDHIKKEEETNRAEAQTNVSPNSAAGKTFKHSHATFIYFPFLFGNLA